MNFVRYFFILFEPAPDEVMFFLIFEPLPGVWLNVLLHHRVLISPLLLLLQPVTTGSEGMPTDASVTLVLPPFRQCLAFGVFQILYENFPILLTNGRPSCTYNSKFFSFLKEVSSRHILPTTQGLRKLA